MDDRAMFGDDPTPAAPCDGTALTETGSGPLAAGLVPVAVSSTRRRIRLLQLGGVLGSEQSFRHTVSRWRAHHPELQPVELSWSVFMARATQTPMPPPAGFVFNVARCGSTLLANMLSAPAGCLTLKESSTVGVLLRELQLAESDAERLEIETLLGQVIPLYAGLGLPVLSESAPLPGAPDAAATGPPRLFVKPHSLSTDAADALLRVFPQTPAIFLFRNPVEVVASMLAHAPYGDLYAQPRDAMVATFPQLAALPAGLSRTAFYAALWCLPVAAALRLPAERVLLVEYAELVARPRAVIERLARHLGLSLDTHAVEAMLTASGVYAKDASGQAAFDAAGRHRRPPLDPAARAEVQLMTGDLLAQLTARQRAQNAS